MRSLWPNDVISLTFSDGSNTIDPYIAFCFVVCVHFALLIGGHLKSSLRLPVMSSFLSEHSSNAVAG